MRFFRSGLAWATALCIGLACGGGNGGGPPASTLSIQKAATNSGDAQTDTARAVLANPLRVLVQRDNTPAQGVSVTWTVPTGQGSVASSSTPTDAQGIASVMRTLGPTAGAQTTNAAASGATGSPVTFTATALAGNATVLEKTSGDGGRAGPTRTVTYTVTVRDQNGNGKSGVTIDWAVGTGGGSINPPQNQSGTGGAASAARTLSSNVGDHTATATAIGQTVTFTTTAAIGAAAAAVTVGPGTTFGPSEVEIAEGGEVTWTWAAGSIAHNVTFEGGAGAPANCGTVSSGTCARTFPTFGTFNYTCTIHGAAMSGVVRVL